MANNQRRTAPGAVIKSTSHNKPPSSNQPRIARAQPFQPRPAPAPLPTRPPVQLKPAGKVPTTPANRGVGPHINQHSAHLQRTVQMKMNQARGANRVVSPSRARTSGVVQPACIADFFSGCWRAMTSCLPSSRQQQYQEIPDRGTELRPTSTPRVEVRTPTLRMVDQEVKIKDVPYPASLNAVYVAGCALVIFCGADSFDCYHPSGGIYNASHGLRGDPTRIYYVYRSEATDSSAMIQDYHRQAALYRLDGGRAPLTVYGQRGVKANICVDVFSDRQIAPHGGTFI